jgi:alkanesulfonate monooxygenase SsuD/methylene tetrahydromethanopterin reductase-like flavin-dependent oxidoreductase (luciferase family)
MKRSISLQMADFEPLLPAAKAIEAAGLGAWTTELPARNAILRAAHVAAQTTTMPVGTAIAYSFTRHPVATATEAVEMDAISGGRFRLGLGSGHAAHWSWYGVDWSHPASRLEEYVEVIRAAFAASGRLVHHGRFYDIDVPGLSYPARSGVDLLGSGLNAAMLRAISRSCDGVLLHPIALFDPFLDEVALPAIESGIPAGRRFSKIASVITVVDTDRDVARQRARRTLGFYLSQTAFGPASSGSKWEEFVTEFRTRVSGDGFKGVAEAAGTIPDDLLDSCVVAGTPDEAADRIAAFTGRLADRGFEEIIYAPVYDGLSSEESVAMVELLSATLSA